MVFFVINMAHAIKNGVFALIDITIQKYPSFPKSLIRNLLFRYMTVNKPQASRSHRSWWECIPSCVIGKVCIPTQAHGNKISWLFDVNSHVNI